MKVGFRAVRALQVPAGMVVLAILGWAYWEKWGQALVGSEKPVLLGLFWMKTALGRCRGTPALGKWRWPLSLSPLRDQGRGFPGPGAVGFSRGVGLVLAPKKPRRAVPSSPVVDGSRHLAQTLAQGPHCLPALGCDCCQCLL